MTGERVDGYKIGSWPWGQFHVIVSIDDGLWHMSISHPRRDLSYEELKTARYRFVPHSVNMAMLFPPPEQFVNFHEHCFQFWEVPVDPTTEAGRSQLTKFNKVGAKVRAKERSQRYDNSDGFR